MIPQWTLISVICLAPDPTLELAAALALALALAALRFGDAILLKLKALIRKIGREQEQGKGENKNRGGAPLHLETGGGPLQQPGGRRFSGPCSGAAAVPARRRRAGSSWSWGPCGLRPWLVVAGEGGGCSGGCRPRVAARVARGGAGRAEQLRVGESCVGELG